MARQTINTGSSANDGQGDTLRQAGTKLNANFSEVYNLLGGDNAGLDTVTHLTDSGIDFPHTTYDTKLKATQGSGTNTITLPNVSGTVTLNGATQTLTNKTLTAPVITLPQINDLSSNHQYILTTGELTADRNVNLPVLADSDTFTFIGATQTLTNKTLTSPVINTSTITSPKIVTSILDTNGNVVFKVTPVGSAVNHIDIHNAAASGIPTIEAHGTDTNISIDFSGKGTGAVITEKQAYGATTMTANGTAAQTSSHIICNKGSSLAVAVANGTVVGEIKIFTNKGVGTATLTPVSLAGSTTIAIQTNESVALIWDATNWFVTGGNGYALA